MDARRPVSTFKGDIIANVDMDITCIMMTELVFVSIAS